MFAGLGDYLDSGDKAYVLGPTELETYLPGKADQDCTATVYTNSKGPSYTEGRMPYWPRSYVKKPKLKPSAYYRTGAGSIASIEVDSTLAIRPAVWIDTEQYIVSLSADMPAE